jgi:hypothetical protein
VSVTDSLRGARVRRAVALSPCSIALELRGHTLRGALIVSAERDAQGIGWLRALPGAYERVPALQSLEGHAFERFERIGGASVRLVFAPIEARVLALLVDGRARGLALIDAGPEGQLLWQRGKPRVSGAMPPERFEPASDLEELGRDGDTLAPQLERIAHDARAGALIKALVTEGARRERRLVAIEGDIARSAQADALRRDASLVLTHLHTLSGVSGELSLLDLESDPPLSRSVTIDPKLGAQRQAATWFERARKLQRGALLAQERAAQTKIEITALAALRARAEAASDAELQALQQAARAFGIAPAQSAPASSASKRKPIERVPYREFHGSADRPIWVGRGAGDNDALTLRHAKPHDLWLHARDQSGAHVVVPLARNESCPPELLCDAATLAAHFSSAREEPRADVIYTPRRYVQKPRKAAPGSVLLLREKVFRLELEPERLKRLLAREQAPDPTARRR